MKALKLRKILWSLIFLKFIDIITTILAVKYLGAREANSLGFDVVIIFSIIIMFMIFYFALYYPKDYYAIKYYKPLIFYLDFVVLLYIITCINNSIVIITLLNQ